jgi:hypothetical protein
MFKASITLAALIAAVSLASAPVFARGGGGGGGGGSGGGGGQHTSPPANKAVASPSKSNTTSKIFTGTAKGTHYKNVKIP